MLRKAAGTSTFMLRRGRERERGWGGGAHNDMEKCWLAVSVFSYLYWQ